MKETLFRQSVGNTIKAAREKKKLTQDDIAYLCGASRTSITNAEKGRQMLPFHRLAILCAVLEIKIDDLIDWKSLRSELKTSLGVLKLMRAK